MGINCGGVNVGGEKGDDEGGGIIDRCKGIGEGRV